MPRPGSDPRRVLRARRNDDHPALSRLHPDPSGHGRGLTPDRSRQATRRRTIEGHPIEEGARAAIPGREASAGLSAGPIPGRCCGCLPDCGPGLARREFASGEVYHAADAVLRFHQLEAAIDLVERELVGDERVHVDLTGEIALDELRYLVASLDAAERRARDA